VCSLLACGGQGTLPLSSLFPLLSSLFSLQSSLFSAQACSGRRFPFPLRSCHRLSSLRLLSFVLLLQRSSLCLWLLLSCVLLLLLPLLLVCGLQRRRLSASD
jgi:hypothetical protein